MSSLFDILNAGAAPQNGMLQMIQQFRQFQRNFKGDPRQQIQSMLNSGQITQAQFNNAVKMANQLQNMLK